MACPTIVAVVMTTSLQVFMCKQSACTIKYWNVLQTCIYTSNGSMPAGQDSRIALKVPFASATQLAVSFRLKEQAMMLEDSRA